MRSFTRALSVVALTAMMSLAALPAFAHVTVRADDPAPGGFAKYTVRVPNESDEAATTSVEIELPEGYEEARYQPLDGWDISIDAGVLTIEGGRIEPGQFQEFSFSAQNPEEPGDITFPAIQTYEDGEEARWVGEPDSDKPAPVVTIGGAGAATGGHGGDASEEATEVVVTPTDDATEAEESEEAEPSEEPTNDGASDDADPLAGPDTTATASSGGSNTMSIIALITGLLGLALGGAAFARSGRNQRA